MPFKKLSKAADISFSIERYDDIFSDFDPRPFSKRALSAEFLSEAERATRDKADERIELKFFVPAKKRKLADEAVIRKRLHEHFKKHFDIHVKELRGLMKEGCIFVVVGILLMIVATFILFKYQDKGFWTSFLVVLLEPGGWFLFWEGLDLLIWETKKKRPNFEFYKKMYKCKITFLNK